MVNNQASLAEVRLSSIRSDGKPINDPAMGKQFDFQSIVHVNQKAQVKALLLADSGASGEAFVDKNFVRYHKLPMIRLYRPVKLRLADNKRVPNITHKVEITFSLGTHLTTVFAFVTDLGKYNIILGMPWLEKHDPLPSYKHRYLHFNSDHCTTHCIPNHRPTTVYSNQTPKEGRRRPGKIEDHGDICEISAYTLAEMTKRENHELVVM